MSPGEAFFIGAKQKKHIRLINTIIGVLTLVMFGAALHFYDKGPENFIFSMWILILLFPVFGFIYFATLASYIKTQKMQPATTIHQQGLSNILFLLRSQGRGESNSTRLSPGLKGLPPFRFSRASGASDGWRKV